MLQWIISPLAGAVIGYSTNYLAIKMLFRPFTQKKIFGIPIPFTPGIIPAKRKSLAVNIANMVSDKLLNANAVRDYLNNSENIKLVRSRISEITHTFLNKPVSYFRTFSHSVFQQTAAKQLRRWSPYGGVKLLLWLSKKLYTLPLKGRIQIKGFQGIHQNTQFRKQLLEIVVTTLREKIYVKDLITESDWEKLLPWMQDRYLSIVDFFINWLEKPQVRKYLEKYGKMLLRKTVARLSTIQRLVVTAGSFDASLEDSMEDIVLDALNSVRDFLQEEETQDSFFTLLKEKKNQADEQSVFTAFGLSSDGLDSILDHIFQVFENGRAAFETRIQNSIDDKSITTLGELLYFVFGVTEKRLRKVLFFGGTLFTKFGKTPVNSDSLDVRLGELFNISEKSKKMIDFFIFRFVSTILNENIAVILAHIDLKTLIIQRIDGLEIVEVEKLLLMVIEKHLKWINIFGAFLGAIIGLIQLLIVTQF